MKLFIVLFIHVSFALAFPGREESFFTYTDEYGTHLVDLRAPNINLLNKLTLKPSNQYILYTRHNPSSGQTLVVNNATSIATSYFNASNPTVVIVHGWLGDQNAEPNPTLRQAFLSKSDVNVIILDWGQLAQANYVTAALSVPPVGRDLGKFLKFLNTVTGATFSNMHLIGFSLGAHIVGVAGRFLGGQVARITALDPAGPLWRYNINRLRSSDAIYVEAIHTDAGVFGLNDKVGDADFFPNGGSIQPGCYNNRCNHYRSGQLYAATLTENNLQGQLCSNMPQAELGKCHGTSLEMGNDDLNKRGSGIYKLNTGRQYPFS